MFYRCQFHNVLRRPSLCLAGLHAFTVVLLLTLLPTLNAMHLPTRSNTIRNAEDMMVQIADISRRTVYNPRITNPDNHTVWAAGSTVTVTWDTHDIPSDITNSEGKVVLGYIKRGSTNEHLDLNHPLASGFDIRVGKISFKVPKVPPRSNYIIVLFGDSGNHSPTFRISHS